MQREVRFRGNMRDTGQQLGANGTAQNAVQKWTCTKSKRILTCPLLPCLEKNGGTGESSVADSVVGSCCAAPEKDMA